MPTVESQGTFGPCQAKHTQQLQTSLPGLGLSFSFYLHSTEIEIENDEEIVRSGLRVLWGKNKEKLRRLVRD